MAKTMVGKALFPWLMEVPSGEDIPCSLWRTHTGRGRCLKVTDPMENPPWSSVCDSMEDPRWSTLFLKDPWLWKGPILEQFMKDCSLWEGPMLEKVMDDCLPWEWPHTGAGESVRNHPPEEEGVAETGEWWTDQNLLSTPPALVLGRRQRKFRVKLSPGRRQGREDVLGGREFFF